MVRQLKIDAVSFKKRSFLTLGLWVNADRDFDLKDILIGQTYPIEVSQRLDGRWVAHRIVKEGN